MRSQLFRQFGIGVFLSAVVGVGFLIYELKSDDIDSAPTSLATDITVATEIAVVKAINKPKARQIDSLSCTDLVERVETVTQIKEVRDGWLTAYFLGLQQQKVPWRQLDILAEQAGISPGTAISVLPRKHAPQIPKEKWTAGFEAASIEDARMLLSLVKDDSVDNVAYYLGSDSGRQLYSDLPLFTFVLANTTKRNIALLETLYDQGFSPTRLDLYYGLQINLPEDILLDLVKKIGMRQQLQERKLKLKLRR